jgi:hypothetical protein
MEGSLRKRSRGTRSSHAQVSGKIYISSISTWKVIRIIHLAEGKPRAPHGLSED